MLHSFEDSYGVNCLTLIDIPPFPIEHRVRFGTQERVKEMTKLHEQIRA